MQFSFLWHNDYGGIRKQGKSKEYIFFSVYLFNRRLHASFQSVDKTSLPVLMENVSQIICVVMAGLIARQEKMKRSIAVGTIFILAVGKMQFIIRTSLHK